MNGDRRINSGCSDHHNTEGRRAGNSQVQKGFLIWEVEVVISSDSVVLLDAKLSFALYTRRVSAISTLATGWRAQSTETLLSAPQKFLSLFTNGRSLVEAKTSCSVETRG